MGLLNHDMKKDERPEMKHGADFVVEKQVKREDIVQNSEQVTYSTNVRVDNHVRNQLTALVNVGAANNVRELEKKMISAAVDQLLNSDQSRFYQILRILEEKDMLTSRNK